MSGGEGALDKYWAFLKETYRQKYSEIAADHIVFPRNTEELIDHNGFGIMQDSRDNAIAVWLKIENDTVTGVAFSSDDCAACTASGSVATELIRGKPVTEVLNITPDNIIEALDGLPEEDQDCARSAVDAIRMAIKDYQGSNS